VPLLALVALFIVVPIAELYVIIQVGGAIGIWWTILLLLADSVLGSLLLRAQGRSVWRRFNTALAEGKMPNREVLDGVLVVFGGAFLITPGFLTDIVGLLLLIPPTRSLVRRLLVRRLGRRISVGVAGRPRVRYDVDGTAHEYENPRDRDAGDGRREYEVPPGRLER
jgi:UPF0716 protein FxsA